MHLIFSTDMKNIEHFEFIDLVLNAVSDINLSSFIKAIDAKKDWAEELGWCYFEKMNGIEYYRFKTFEGNTFWLTYHEFIEYVRIAITKYLIGCKSEKNKELINSVLKESIFSDMVDNLDTSLSTDIPLWWG